MISADDDRYRTGTVGVSGNNDGCIRSVRICETEPPPPLRPFRRGDCNNDGAVDIADASCILNWLFIGGATPQCLAATNTNGDAEETNIADATYLLNHLFLGGPPLPAPYPACGSSELPADIALGCAEYTACP